MTAPDLATFWTRVWLNHSTPILEDASVSVMPAAFDLRTSASAQMINPTSAPIANGTIIIYPNPELVRAAASLFAGEDDSSVPTVGSTGIVAGSDRDRRLVAIRNHASRLFDDDSITDCEALARLIEWMLEKYAGVYLGTFNNDEETFVEDLTLVLTDRSENGATSPRDDKYYIGYGYAVDSGFKAEYKDGTNQVRHFWAFVSFGFQYGRAIGSAAAIEQESPADRALGLKGASIGAGLDGMGESLEGLAEAIREELCDNQDK
jgi:hypothetical protein